MRTPRLYMAAALISLGAGKKGVDRTDKSHMQFILTFSSPIADEDAWFEKNVKAWEDRTMVVNAQAFTDAIQDLKSEVHK